MGRFVEHVSGRFHDGNYWLALCRECGNEAMHGYHGHLFPHFVLTSCCRMRLRNLRFYCSAVGLESASCVMRPVVCHSENFGKTRCVCVWRFKILCCSFGLWNKWNGYFWTCFQPELGRPFEQPPLFGKERNSLWMETLFFSNPPCLWERGRG